MTSLSNWSPIASWLKQTEIALRRICIKRRNVKAFRRLFFWGCLLPAAASLFVRVASGFWGEWSLELPPIWGLSFAIRRRWRLLYGVFTPPRLWRPVSPLSAREGEPICRYLLQLIFALLRLQISLSCQYFSFIPHPLKISLGDSKNCLLRQFLLS